MEKQIGQWDDIYHNVRRFDKLPTEKNERDEERGSQVQSFHPTESHCYCRLLELLVNVWAYHSARKMVYINPHSDLTEGADDKDPPYEMWQWPLTGKISCQGSSYQLFIIDIKT
ncbi:UNVERIFIED_CONTAM: hypothetical protein Scaly_2515400 [Sesamum calycinum]|uniref:Uncharacterized protein n=1 Tax=Sesamum calycinum TaxID=2727403 RepID=A0AAW2LSP9_9LAMI